MDKLESHGNGLQLLFLKICKPNSSSNFILWLFLVFEIRLGKYMCLTRGCDFVIHRKYKLQDERLQTNKMKEPTLTTAPLREFYHRLFIQQCLFLVAVRNFRGKS